MNSLGRFGGILKATRKAIKIPLGSLFAMLLHVDSVLSAVTYELHHSGLLQVDFLSHLPSLLRISEILAIKVSSNDRTVKVSLKNTIFSESHDTK